MVSGYPHEKVDPDRIAEWFNDLNWGMDKIIAEQEWMLDEHNLGYTTEISANWSDIGRIYKAAMHRIRTEYPYVADLTMLGAHSSHSYQTGTNLYFVYDYNINCEPHRGDHEIPHSAERHHRGGGPQTRGLDGPSPRHRQVPDRLDRTRARQCLLHVAQAQGSLRPERIMNRGTIFKA